MLQAPPTTLSDLPAALTAQVLRHVPEQPRLTQCALVCRAWASAAAVGTVHVERELTASTKSTFQAWLDQHAGQLLSLQLSAVKMLRGPQPPQRSLRLPWNKFKQLQQLKISYLDLQLPGEAAAVSVDQLTLTASDSVDHAAAELPLSRLQHLDLFEVQLASTSSLLQLTHAPQLTSLTLDCVEITELQFVENTPASWAVQYAEEAAAVARMLQRLRRLAVLEMPDMFFSQAAVQQSAAMQGLRQVSLSQYQHLPPCDLQRLPSSITKLQIQGAVASARRELGHTQHHAAALFCADRLQPPHTASCEVRAVSSRPAGCSAAHVCCRPAAAPAHSL